MRSQDGEGNKRDKQGKGREGKERKGKRRKGKEGKGHGSQWLDGCDVGNAPSSERASTFHLFPIQQNCFHPPFIPPSPSHLPPQQLHPPPPPPPQHFPIISHQPHTSPPNMSLSCMSLSPPTSPRPHRIGRREEKREEKRRKDTKTTTNPSSIRPPTSEAIGHRPRHPLQPCRIPRRPGPRLWRHIPPRYASKQQRGVLQVQGGCFRWCRLGHFAHRLRRPVIRCGSSHQRHRYSVLQGRCIPWRSDLRCLVCPIGTSFSSQISITPLTLHSSSHKSPPRSALLTRSPSAPLPVSSRRSVCRCSSPTGVPAPTHSTRASSR